MSRAYRIRVRESVQRVIRAHDRVSTQLEILEVLPAAEMAELLAHELAQRGFERDGDECGRERDGMTLTVDVQTGAVTVLAESAREVKLESDRSDAAYDDVRGHARQVRDRLKEQVKKDLEREAAGRTEQLQSEVTDKLEKQLGDVRRELDQAVNRATAEALKQKAARMGRIKEMTEDEETGSLTIVVEV